MKFLELEMTPPLFFFENFSTIWDQNIPLIIQKTCTEIVWIGNDTQNPSDFFLKKKTYILAKPDVPKTRLASHLQLQLPILPIVATR